MVLCGAGPSSMGAAAASCFGAVLAGAIAAADAAVVCSICSADPTMLAEVPVKEV